MFITSKPFYSALSLLLRKCVVDVVTFLSWHFFQQRASPPVLGLQDLPGFSLRVISHNHYAYLNWKTLQEFSKEICYVDTSCSLRYYLANFRGSRRRSQHCCGYWLVSALGTWNFNRARQFSDKCCRIWYPLTENIGIEGLFAWPQIYRKSIFVGMMATEAETDMRQVTT